ncbi:MAG: sulfite exporter TauE/SafE family protein [Nitrospira sp.]|nr:sulfite exporter TauE/SafE family protein [Nitrospira sp.]
MTDPSYLTILGLGFVLGLRHALDADHIAAVSTVLATRPSWRASGVIGFSWGLGHTLVLLFVGAVALALQVSIPESVANAAEFAVGLMLIALGGTLAVRVLRERWHSHGHDHGGHRHEHLHSHAATSGHGHAHWWSDSLKPLCIGMAHGLAGSAALVLVVVAASRTVLEGLAYIAVFGLGSIIGMMLIGLLLSLPVVWSLSLGRQALLAVQGLAGLGSIGLGLSMLFRIAMGERPL